MTIQKSKKQTSNSSNLFPFSRRQLNFFREEINEAGGFHELMFSKRALQRRMGMKYISEYRNIYLYRNKYLIGVYESLKPFYDTVMPFIFWSEMYEALLQMEFKK